MPRPAAMQHGCTKPPQATQPNPYLCIYFRSFRVTRQKWLSTPAPRKGTQGMGGRNSNAQSNPSVETTEVENVNDLVPLVCCGLSELLNASS